MRKLVSVLLFIGVLLQVVACASTGQGGGDVISNGLVPHNEQALPDCKNNPNEPSCQKR